jgi:RHS repeat-associated protein
VGGSSLQYDADGNLTSDGLRTYQYDPQSRLVRVNGPEGVTGYEYDALGNRIASIINGQRTEHLLDPTGLVNVLAQHDAGGSLVARFVHGQGLAARASAAGQNSFYDFDLLGSSAALTDAAGTPVNRYNYLPFGETLSASEAIPNPFRFVGQFGVAHEGNELSFMRARFLHGNLGRFTAIDPIRLGGADLNFYRYVGNSPMRFVDPLGTAASFGYAANDANVIVAEKLGQQKSSGSINDSAASQLADVEKEFDEFNPPNPPAPDPSDPDPLDDRKIPVRNSGDPNEKFGAAGVGARNWVPSDTVIPYRINFENVGPGSVDANGNPFPKFADAPAQLVTITDQLNTNLDWSTFELVELGFGDTIVPIPAGRKHYAGSVSVTVSNDTFNVEMEAGIDSPSGLVFATFQSIDPQTSLPPSLAGFLPPEDGTGRGKGHFSFLVRTRTNLTDGVEIRNVALIEFDHQPIIATDQVDPQNPGAGVSTNRQALNTTDAGPPSSTVAALPAESTSPFAVQWSGSDDPLGSGVASYDIYASTNGGLFAPWILGTNGTTASFAGEVGKTYAFYSIARDYVGSAETPPLTADASTTVVPAEPLTPPTLSIGLGGGGLITLSWPSVPAGFVLESAENLTPPVVWQEVTSGIVENGGIKSYSVTNDPGVPGRLYRLRLP